MSDFLDRISTLSPKRLALLALELHEQIEDAAVDAHAPIAVVGMGCRFPGGANDPESYWKLLRDGRDAIREVPSDRWDINEWYNADPDAPGSMSVRYGGFLDRVDGFDPAFFGIAPREALTMDPQHRLLLEVAWESLEHAGIAPDSLFGTQTGVFIGVCNNDYTQRVMNRGADTIDTYFASGGAHSVAAGRLSYTLGLQGPALAIDTACSSSLVALHVACRSLRSGETNVALAGGVNLMCSPETTVALTKGHMLAPDGRCKTFDARADGFARGEGCGVLVLKRLADAQADGDRILALIRGTAVNQDGRSGGLTVPNGPAQEAVIRAALADARIKPEEVSYVEAHGTGTSLGDPIEVRALGNALRPSASKADSLLIGSVKTNLGHLESAAGVAGIMKVILSLQNSRIPRHLHFETPSPHIAWSDTDVEVTSAAREWPRGSEPRRAGVSSFGFSGTNSHVIVEEAPLDVAQEQAPQRPVQCIPLSARSDAALRAIASQYADALQGNSGVALADVAHTASVGRSHSTHRAAVVASTNAEAQEALRSIAMGGTHASTHRGVVAPGNSAEVVFLYTGAGAQYPGMAMSLYNGSPLFRDIIDRCDAILGADEKGRTLLSVLREPANANASVHEMMWTQPALFAVEYATTQLWRSWGIEPAAVIGHSAGEYVAACVAGVFSLEDGLRLIAARGRLMQSLPPGGAMAAVYVAPDEIRDALLPYRSTLAIAALNAPDSVVVSGDADALDEFLATLAKQNIEGKKLFVSLAAHSPLVDPILDQMEAFARNVPMRAPEIPIAWNLSGSVSSAGSQPDANYWRNQMRQPVRFAEGISALYNDGYRIFLEVGPHPTLNALAQRSLPEVGPLFVSSMRREHDDWRETTVAVAELYAHGAPLNFAGMGKPYALQRVSLPTYQFERKRFWIDTVPAGAANTPRSQGADHLFAGVRLNTANPTYETSFTPDHPSWLAEHRVHGTVLAAAPVFLELAQSAAQDAFGVANREVRDFAIHAPLVVPSKGRVVQVQLSKSSENSAQFAIHSRSSEASHEWTLHANGTIAVADAVTSPASPATLSQLSLEMGATRSASEHYARLASIGIELGAAFQGIRTVQSNKGATLVSIKLDVHDSLEQYAWSHPSLIDCALQTVGLAVPDDGSTTDAFLLTSIGRAVLSGKIPPQFHCYARLRDAASQSPSEWHADLTLLNEAGDVIGSLDDVCIRRATHASLARAVRHAAGSEDLYYEVAWEPVPATTLARAEIAGSAEIARGMREQFAALSAQHGLAVYAKLLPRLDSISASHIRTALRELKFDDAIGREFSLTQEAARLNIAPQHMRLFGRLLEILEEERVVTKSVNGFRVASSLDAADPESLYEPALAEFGSVSGELSMLRRCGPSLARVLRGMQDPLELLFPGGSFAEARTLYVDSPFAQTFNGAVADALRNVIGSFPTDRKLRILEVGGGTGGTTSYVLGALPRDRVEYTFTDISPLFLQRANEQFGSRTGFRTAPFDVERSAQSQGFAPGSFDVVIAANVLHATADLRTSVDNVKALLAPSGLLMLLEGVDRERWIDLTFGLTDGWWRFTDAPLRTTYPLISRQAWSDLLVNAGFADIEFVPDGTSSARDATQHAIIVARAGRSNKTWTLVGDRGGIGELLEQKLRARGDRVTLLDADALGRSLAQGAANTADDTFTGDVVYLGALELRNEADNSASPDATSQERALQLSCALPLAFLGAMAQRASSGRVWLVTRQAQSVAPADRVERWQSPLLGVGRVFALEQPSRWGGLIDLPANTNADSLASLLVDELDVDDGQDQIALRNGTRLAARLTRASQAFAHAARFHADASYLVTGGFGGLGAVVGHWMAQRGARHIVLLGRNPDATSEGVRAIEALGARVTCIAGDIASESDVASLMQRFGNELPALRGIMHTAADLSVAPIGSITNDQVARMLRPKVVGTVLLEQFTRHMNLDFLVLFSSSTALLGAAGFAHYAAANAFLDATAQDARHQRRDVLSIDWGTWEVMRLASSASQKGFAQAGLRPMPVEDALAALGAVIASRRPQTMVADVNWSTLKPLHEARRPRPFLARMTATPASASTHVEREPSGPSLADRLRSAPASTRNDLLIEFVQGEVASVLEIPVAKSVPVQTGLFDLGMDSLMAVELKRRLERGSGMPMPSTLTFNYPNVGALARFLESRLNVSDLQQTASPTATAAPPASTIAVPDANLDLDSLTDEQLEARLLARLEQSE